MANLRYNRVHVEMGVGYLPLVYEHRAVLIAFQPGLLRFYRMPQRVFHSLNTVEISSHLETLLAKLNTHYSQDVSYASYDAKALRISPTSLEIFFKWCGHSLPVPFRYELLFVAMKDGDVAEVAELINSQTVENSKPLLRVGKMSCMDLGPQICYLPLMDEFDDQRINLLAFDTRELCIYSLTTERFDQINHSANFVVQGSSQSHQFGYFNMSRIYEVLGDEWEINFARFTGPELLKNERAAQEIRKEWLGNRSLSSQSLLRILHTVMFGGNLESVARDFNLVI